MQNNLTVNPSRFWFWFSNSRTSCSHFWLFLFSQFVSSWHCAELQMYLGVPVLWVNWQMHHFLECQWSSMRFEKYFWKYLQEPAPRKLHPGPVCKGSASFGGCQEPIAAPGDHICVRSHSLRRAGQFCWALSDKSSSYYLAVTFVTHSSSKETRGLIRSKFPALMQPCEWGLCCILLWEGSHGDPLKVRECLLPYIRDALWLRLCWKVGSEWALG